MPRTADELDFIIYYDITYRAGRDAEEEARMRSDRGLSR